VLNAFRALCGQPEEHDVISTKRLAVFTVVCVVGFAALAGSAGSRTAATSTLVVAATTAPDTLDPQKSPLNQTWPYWQLSYECLLRTLPSGKVLPWLATGYTVNPAGTVYDFTLRSGVKFHDGSTLTANDVVYSFNRLKSSGIPYAQNRFPTLQSVTAVAPNKVEFTLSGPQPGFLLNMGDPFTVACAILSQKSAAADLANKMVGTGPFSLVSYSPNHELVFKRFDKYWGKKAALPNLDILIVPDPSSQLVGLTTGKVGLIFPDPSIVRALLGANKKIKLGSVISATNLRVEFSAATEPFNNVNVRRAVELAVDKRAAVVGTYLGYGAPATYIPGAYSWGPPGSAYTYAGKHDVAQAKQLLTQAGYPSGFSTNFIYTTNIPAIQRFAEVFQSQLAQIGIKLTLQPLDTPTFLAQLGSANYGLAFNQYPFFADPSLYVTPRPNRNGPVPGQIQQLVSALSQANSPDAYVKAIGQLAVAEDEQAFPNFSVASPTQFVAYQRATVHNVKIDFTAGWLFFANVSLS
jgi:ABC-type transport system substrate-binding protein